MFVLETSCCFLKLREMFQATSAIVVRGFMRCNTDRCFCRDITSDLLIVKLVLASVLMSLTQPALHCSSINCSITNGVLTLYCSDVPLCRRPLIQCVFPFINVNKRFETWSVCSQILHKHSIICPERLYLNRMACLMCTNLNHLVV